MNALVPQRLAFGLPPARATQLRWAFVEIRFRRLFSLIAVPEQAVQEGLKRASRITAALNRTYWPQGTPAPRGVLVGSWGKATRVHPSADLDLLYILPNAVFWRFEQRTERRQSALLQEVRSAVAPTYPNTTLRADGQVIQVRCESLLVEVVPAFELDAGQFLTCDTNSGGRYKISDPGAQLRLLDRADQRTGGRARQLARLAKLWRRASGAEISAFALELLAAEFLVSWPYAQRDWWDWLFRDFMVFLLGRVDTFVAFPGTGELHWLGNGWKAKAERALRAANHACAYEDLSLDDAAATAWATIFGRKVLGA